MFVQFVDFMDSYESFFSFLDTSWYLFLLPVFMLTLYKTGNVFCYAVCAEIIASALIRFTLIDIHPLLFFSAQFAIYGMCIVLITKKPLIAFSYFILMAFFVIQFILNSIYYHKLEIFNLTGEGNASLMNSYYWLGSVYYIYHIAIVALVNTLIILSMKNNWGKGYADRLHNSSNGAFYNNSELLNFIKLRLKTDSKERLERVEKT